MNTLQRPALLDQPAPASRGRVVDLRSDTVTQPSTAMRTAMTTAPVGDDAYREDPTVAALETHVADLFGHDAALFVPSGTLANLLAVLVHASPGDEVLCEANSDMAWHQGGAAAAAGGVYLHPYRSRTATLDLNALHSELHTAALLGAPIVALAVEQPTNLSGGRIQPIGDLASLREIADDAGLAVHIDGARIWHAHAATGIALDHYGRLADTIAVCLAKDLGAPTGALLTGTTSVIARARRMRKRLGGTQRQAGIEAAAGLFALQHHLPQLGEDHQRAAALATGLSLTGVVDPQDVDTNIVLLDLTASSWSPAAFADAARQQDVLLCPISPTTVRVVIHRDITEGDLAYAVDVLAALLWQPRT